MRASRQFDNAPSRVSSSEGHRLWARTYDSDPNPLLALEFRILSGKLPDLKDKLFLDLACGTGRWASEAQARSARVYGMDISPEMLRRAQRKTGQGRLLIADCESVPFRDGRFEVVLLAFAFGYLEHRDRVIRELHRVVKPGGSIYFSDLHPDALHSGWTRSFRCGDQVLEIASFPYTVAELRAEAARVGLQEQEIWEACLDEPELEIFARAGREALFENARGIPAVLAVHWKRPG